MRMTIRFRGFALGVWHQKATMLRVRGREETPEFSDSWIMVAIGPLFIGIRADRVRP